MRWFLNLRTRARWIGCCRELSQPANTCKVALVVIVHFRDGKLAHEHIYWDQASVLAQLGLIDSSKLPVAGVESAEKVLDPHLPSNRAYEQDFMMFRINKMNHAKS